jgi:DNA-binding Lrp family transcriptional regulator
MVKQQLDKIDFRILSILRTQGRISNVQLANLVGLSASPCLERVKRLETLGIIMGYSAQLNPSVFGPTVTILAEISLKSHGIHDFSKFERKVRVIPEVAEVYQMGGRLDYLVKLICRDVSQFQDIMEDLLRSEDVPISTFYGHIVLKEIKHTGPMIPLLEQSTE